MLLEGLPADYDAIKQNIKIPREPALTWEQIVFLLEDYADDPKIPGYSQKTGQDTAHITQNLSTDICRHFATNGQCRFGKRCKYRHVEKPSSTQECSFCGKRNHKEQDCRHRAQAIAQLKQQLKNSTKAAEEKASSDQRQDAALQAYEARVPAEPIEAEPTIDHLSF